MTKRVRVNVSTRVLANAIRREERNGRQVIVVPSVTMPDDIVMNDVFYPADEIKSSFGTLNRTPAPLGHPEDANGAFLSARDPVAINEYYVGAHNENVRQEKNEDGRFRVHVDKVIDVAVANRTEEGKALIEAIDKGEPIHTSTGLWANISEAENEDYSWIASDIQFDHDAILLNEIGAATPEQGVGMMVNKDGKTEEVEVINSMLDAAEQELEWAAQQALRALDTQAKAPIIERLVSAMKEAFASMRETTATNSKETPKMDEEQFNTLSATVDALAEDMATMKDALANSVTAESVAEAVANAVKPLTDQLDAANAAQKEKDDAELAELTEKIVKANLLSEDEAKELTLNMARTLAKKCEPGKAAPIASAFQSNTDEDEFKDYDPNVHLKEAS